ncbi:MAG: sigma-70 family RNA polymerase sigma factor [Patescibacteria group bacterium]
MIDGEEDIIKSAIQGEASAFGLLYKHYQPSIYRFVYLKVGRREEAEDLTHHVFLKAWQNIENFKPRGFPFSSWLYRMARNQVIDFYRTAKGNISIDDLDSDIFRSSDDTEGSFDLSLLLASARKAILELKPEHQDVIIMRFVEDLSVREVAEALKKSEGAVKLLQHRAMEKLREILHD